MNIVQDEKILNVLGPAKSGFEWKEVQWNNNVGSLPFQETDAAISNQGIVFWEPGNCDIAKGVVYGAGKFYRQTPTKEVIYVDDRPNCWKGYIYADGSAKNTISDANLTLKDWTNVESRSHFKNLVAHIVKQHEEIQALKTPVEGTFMWAVEQMKAGKCAVCGYGGYGGVGHKYRFEGDRLFFDGSALKDDAQVTKEMLEATDWRIVD